MTFRAWHFVIALVPVGLAAQTTAGFEASTRMSPRFGMDRTALWLGLDLEIERPVWGLQLRGAGVPGGARGGIEGSLGGRLALPLAHRTVLTARFAGVLDQPVGTTTAAEASLRLGFERQHAGWRYAVGILGARGSQAGQRLLGGGYASSAWRLGDLTITGEAGRVVNLDGSLAPAGPQLDTLAQRAPASARSITHVGVGVAWRRDWFETRARVLRRSRVLDHAGLGWEAAVAVDAIPGLRLHAAVGHAPAAQGLFLPYRRQLSFGLQLIRRLDPPAPFDALPAPSVGSAFSIASLGDGGFALTVRHPTAARVELTGDFTDWRPTPLTRLGGGAWQLALPLASGIHHLNVRFDGGPWLVPDGLGVTTDGFGGRVGVLVVPPRADAPR